MSASHLSRFKKWSAQHLSQKLNALFTEKNNSFNLFKLQLLAIINYVKLESEATSILN